MIREKTAPSGPRPEFSKSYVSRVSFPSDSHHYSAHLVLILLAAMRTTTLRRGPVLAQQETRPSTRASVMAIASSPLAELMIIRVARLTFCHPQALTTSKAVSRRQKTFTTSFLPRAV